jgi:hypothetical protein
MKSHNVFVVESGSRGKVLRSLRESPGSGSFKADSDLTITSQIRDAKVSKSNILACFLTPLKDPVDTDV